MITQKELKELLHYEPMTGIFTWLWRPAACSMNQRARTTLDVWNRRFEGRVVGNIRHDAKTSYRWTQIKGCNYSLHRLAWLYVYGSFPVNQIDHIDRNGLNNRIDNLRDVSQSENQRNSSLSLRNKSGYNGVAWDKGNKKWHAYIRAGGKRLHLGFFINKLEAIEAREVANHRYGYHVDHGKVTA